MLFAQSCPTLCDPMDCSPPGSSVHGILQARTPEWVAIPSRGDLPNPGIEPRLILLPPEAPGKPKLTWQHCVNSGCMANSSIFLYIAE